MLIAQFDAELPPYLPVVKHELFADISRFRARPPAVEAGRGADLSVLLAQVLLAFTFDFERESPVSQNDYARLLDAVEQRWRTRFGAGQIGTLRRALHAVIDQRDGGQPRLAQGLAPYPDGWRAHPPFLSQTSAVLEDPAGALPRYPMVLHRGGWPDGS